MTTDWPAPMRDDKSAPFYAAAAESTLAVRRCQDCATFLPPEAAGCTHCGSGRLGWAPTAGTGRLISWTTVHRPPNPAYAELVPYVLGIVELDEGPWLHARIVTAPGQDLCDGIVVRARFVHTEGADSYPVFESDRG